MRVYLDMSLLVAALIREPGTDTAKRFLQAAEGQDWLLSAWTEVELASALSIKCRSGVITTEESAQALQRYGELRSGTLRRRRALSNRPETAGDSPGVIEANVEQSGMSGNQLDVVEALKSAVHDVQPGLMDAGSGETAWMLTQARSRRIRHPEYRENGWLDTHRRSGSRSKVFSPERKPRSVDGA